MRVLQVHKDFEPYRGGGGTARHIHGLAVALSGLGCEVRIVSPIIEPIERPYTTVHANPSDLPGHVAWADVVHVHGARSGYAVRGALAAKMAGKPFFYTPHAFYADRNVANAVAKYVWDMSAERFLLSCAARTILLTPFWRDWLTERRLPSERTEIIPNCVLGSDFSTPTSVVTELAGSPSVLTVGRLDPVKRIQDVIEALTDPLLAKAHLHVVGKGDERARLEQLARDRKVADRVTFYGFVDDEGVSKMMAGSDCFVLASEMEGLPTVLLEALLSQVPVVCTDLPGNLAITTVAGVTTTYRVGDIRSLARLLANSVHETVGADAAQKLRETFTWEYRAKELASLYKEAADL